MADPVAIFKGAPEKHRILEIGWPDLYEALKAAAGSPVAGAARVRPCEVAQRHPGSTERPAAVARLSAGGPAACKACLTQLRPGSAGYPLDINDPRNRS
jgi:hypothetical protein